MTEKRKQAATKNKNGPKGKKHWPLKKKLMIVTLVPLALYVAGSFTLFLGSSLFHCGRFDPKLETKTHEACIGHGESWYGDDLGVRYLLLKKSTSAEVVKRDQDEYTIRLTDDIKPSEDISIYVIVRNAQTKPLTKDEQAFVDSGKHACDDVVYAKSNLEGYNYVYQIRQPKYLYTITYDSRHNSDKGRQEGQDMLDTFFNTIRCSQ